MTEENLFGPVDYVVVEFPEGQLTGQAFPHLVDLVDREIIRILDLVFVRKETDGTLTALELADFDGDGALDLAVFDGVSSGLLGETDIGDAADVLEPGSAAGILVYENRWAEPFVTALRDSGAEFVASGRIPVQDLMDAIEAAESGDES